jgi:hypothetical protein
MQPFIFGKMMNFRGEDIIRILQSDDSGILMEFFRNFDQNAGGKL